MDAKQFKTVDEYFATLPENVRAMMDEMRKLVKQAAPKAAEVISYNMPAIKQNGVLVYYAANKEHIGFYPTAKPIVAFKKELAAYKTSKGAVQLPLGEKLPKTLIKDIVKYRLNEDAARALLKKNKK